MSALRAAAIAALSLASLPSAAVAQPAPVQVIDLVSYSYAPTPIRLRVGAPVTLRFVNRAGKGHDFTAKRFFRSARIIAGRVDEGEVDLRPGQIANVTLVPAPGRYPVHCGRPFHKMLGMRSTIIVQ